MTIWMWKNLDDDTIQKMISQTYELRRDPKEREQEQSQAQLTQWMEENQDLVEQIMGEYL